MGLQKIEETFKNMLIKLSELIEGNILDSSDIVSYADEEWCCQGDIINIHISSFFEKNEWLDNVYEQFLRTFYYIHNNSANIDVLEVKNYEERLLATLPQNLKDELITYSLTIPLHDELGLMIVENYMNKLLEDPDVPSYVTVRKKAIINLFDDYYVHIVNE